jgi:hypothetical protein
LRASLINRAVVCMRPRARPSPMVSVTGFHCRYPARAA